MFLLRFSLSLSLPFPLLFQGDESLVFFLVSFFCFPPKSWANVFGLAVRRGKGGMVLLSRGVRFYVRFYVNSRHLRFEIKGGEEN